MVVYMDPLGEVTAHIAQAEVLEAIAMTPGHAGLGVFRESRAQ